MITHYIIVRRDLPLGVMAAMIAHAAGESGALYQDLYNGRFRGATAVVLEAHDELHLQRIEAHLQTQEIQYVAVHESNGPYHGQFMAIGVVPAEREYLAPKLVHFRTLKSCLDNPSEPPVESLDSNDSKTTETTPNLGLQSPMGRHCDVLTNSSC